MDAYGWSVGLDAEYRHTSTTKSAKYSQVRLEDEIQLIAWFTGDIRLDIRLFASCEVDWKVHTQRFECAYPQPVSVSLSIGRHWLIQQHGPIPGEVWNMRHPAWLLQDLASIQKGGTMVSSSSATSLLINRLPLMITTPTAHGSHGFDESWRD